jgi:hypothetical protein
MPIGLGLLFPVFPCLIDEVNMQGLDFLLTQKIREITHTAVSPGSLEHNVLELTVGGFVHEFQIGNTGTAAVNIGVALGAIPDKQG